MRGVNTIQRELVDIWTPPEILADLWEPEFPGGEGTWTWGGYYPRDDAPTTGWLLAYWTWGGSITWGGCASR